MSGGRRGPAPQPRALKLLKGTFRPDRDGGMPDPEALVEIPKAPAYLSTDAKREWKRVCAELIALGVLTNLDLAALEGYCTAYGRAVTAERSLKKSGKGIRALTMLTPQGWIARPEVAIAKAAWAEARRFAQEFGITPASRTRVPHAKAGGDAPKKDPWGRVAGDRAS
ncbi:MAG: phage terminase small subunit P27 family [Gemmatimonas sp.]|nr:phage terminase small subunit P27 family [Gemmatimonas sp.]